MFGMNLQADRQTDRQTGPPQVAFVKRWSIFGGFSIKIGNKMSLAGLSMAVVDRWPLFRGGR
jgi:hypothetical protein